MSLTNGMKAKDYQIITGDERILDWQKKLDKATWPMFMLQDKVVNAHWSNMYSAFSNFQFAVFDQDQLLGVGNSVPLYWNEAFSALPDRGLDWAIEKANANFQSQTTPNVLVGIQILINKEYQNQGLSYKMLEIMKSIAAQHQLAHVALPVRPVHKSRHPLISMDEYQQWTNAEGLPFDPWIRVHIKSGGKIIKSCNHSMEITGTIAQWEAWTGINMPTSGDYIIDHALRPVKVDTEQDLGTYIEPNTWIVHDIKQ